MNISTSFFKFHKANIHIQDKEHRKTFETNSFILYESAPRNKMLVDCGHKPINTIINTTHKIPKEKYLSILLRGGNLKVLR